MASLTDLFNPTFLMFLGILVLVVALLVVYFETKFREQNHKISSMLSLVSSLAEELNGTKMVVQHLTMRPVSNSQNFQQQQQQQQQPNLEEKFVTNTKLISVSDDEDSDSESGSESGSESDESIEILDDEDEDEEDEEDVEEIDNNSENSVIEIGNNNDIKVLKLNINKNNDDDESSSSSEENNLDFDDLDELDESDNLDKLDDLDKAEITVTETTEDNVQPSDIKKMDLKSININLEETKHESMDYKKMSLPKLRSIVTEKGLTSDSSKLKKNELLKLLGIE